jgi:cytochrome c oxidase subunit 2
VCGQLCGLGHYGMKATLVVDTPADYQAWLKERAALAAESSAPAAAPPKPVKPATKPQDNPPGPAKTPKPGGL